MPLRGRCGLGSAEQIDLTELKVAGPEDWLAVVPTPATWRTPGEAVLIVMASAPVSPVMLRAPVRGSSTALTSPPGFELTVCPPLRLPVLPMKPASPL